MREKKRLDQVLFEKGLVESRERAKTTVMSGLVFVNGQREDKPGTQICAEDEISVKGDPIGFVSRGGLKLEKALNFFDIDVTGLTALDAGASTGGFTDCLLKRGAKKVFAVDVGYGQLAWPLRQDERVVCMERTNIRYVTPEMLGEAADIAVIDLAFISLKLVLPVIRTLIREDAVVACLIKPQFEAGRGQVGKKGVVRDPAVHLEVLENFCRYSLDAGFSVKSITFSPIKGPEGNIEYLGYLGAPGAQDAQPDVASVVKQAHGEL